MTTATCIPGTDWISPADCPLMMTGKTTLPSLSLTVFGHSAGVFASAARSTTSDGVALCSGAAWKVGGGAAPVSVGTTEIAGDAVGSGGGVDSTMRGAGVGVGAGVSDSETCGGEASGTGVLSAAETSAPWL